MIASLSGTVKSKQEKSIVVEVNSVGYLVYSPVQLVEKTNNGDPVDLLIHTKVREDDISLYGFETEKELELFKLLIGINGIGPKLAIEIMSAETDKIKSAILQSDTAFLNSIPGIGKKTAERIIIELKNKISLDSYEQLHSGLSSNTDEDIINAIMNLGYPKHEILRTLKSMPETITHEEEIIKYFLQNV